MLLQLSNSNAPIVRRRKLEKGEEEIEEKDKEEEVEEKEEEEEEEEAEEEEEEEEEEECVNCLLSDGIFDKGNHPQLKDQNDNYSSPNSNAPSEEEEEEEESSNFICVICHPHFSN